MEFLEEQPVDLLSSDGHNLNVKNFIWNQEEWPEIDHDDFEDDEDDIPVVSIRGIRDTASRNHPADYEKTCKEMVGACEKWGFFKLVDHGIEADVVERLRVQLRGLFDLPMEEKTKGARSENLPLGYSASNVEYETNLPWAEIVQLVQSPEMVVAFARKVYGDQHHHPFSSALIEYLQELDKLGTTILQMLAHGLGLPDDFFARNFADKVETVVRANRYPPCPLPEKCLGLGSHSDPHTLTILLPDNVGGLQVMNRDNRWIGVRPLSNAFVINIGDTLEAWTNGRLRSVVHRVVVNKEKSRLSVAYFLSPSRSTIIDCPPRLVDPQSDLRIYVPFTWGQFRTELLHQKRVVGKTALNRYLVAPH